MRTNKLCVEAIVFCRTINTHGNQRKGKVSAVRKSVSKCDLDPIVVKEVKTTSSFMKRFNWENKHLFGDIISVVKSTCKSATKSQVKSKPLDNVDASGHAASEFTLSNKNLSIKLLSPTNSTKTDPLHESVINFPLFKCETNMSEHENLLLAINCLKERSHLSTPSVTAILDKTMPQEQVTILRKWKAKMIKEMGEGNFLLYHQKLLSSGLTLHNTINMYLAGTPETELEVLPTNIGHWRSLKNVLGLISNVRFLEKRITHPFLNYQGVVDFCGNYKDHLVVVDWKTSKKPKLTISETYDAPLQVAAYVGALNFQNELNCVTSKGLIIVAYDNGNPATVHYMSEKILDKYWKQWLGRLSSYWQSVS